MTESINTTYLGKTLHFEEVANASQETMVKVDNVSMIFNMASETMNNLKEYAIALARRELHFKEFRALDHVSLEVKRGDVFGILGTNGSGKSTLLKIIAGVLEPSEGTCEVNGSIAPLIELGAGFDMELTARENIYLNGALLGYSKHFIEQHFDEIVDFAEIERFLDMPLKNYSSGMVARIAFAIATVIVPDILIVDEVLSVGDFMFQKKCESRIQSLIKEHGVTVLIVSHSNEQIERLCNKAVWIEKGHLRMLGTASEVCQVYRTLGGHVGSPQAEKQVYDLLNSTKTIPSSSIQTISGENKYSTAINIFDKVQPVQDQKTIIIASGDDTPSALLASNMSLLTNYPVLLSKKDSVPDLVARTLKTQHFTNAILIGDPSILSKKVEEEIASLIQGTTTRIDELSYSELAIRIYKDYCKVQSRFAVLTYPTCTGDLLSLAPFIANEKAPLFFHVSNGVISQETINVLISGNFSTILVLGGQKSFPDESLIPLSSSGLEIIRFCGDSPLHANKLITDWIDTKISLDYSGAIIASPEYLDDTLTIEPLLLQMQHPVIFEDSRNLDNVADVMDRLKSKNVKVLYFIGNDSAFNQLDKNLLAKAIISPKI